MPLWLACLTRIHGIIVDSQFYLPMLRVQFRLIFFSTVMFSVYGIVMFGKTQKIICDYGLFGGLGFGR